jgi:hypothetical protein
MDLDTGRILASVNAVGGDQIGDDASTNRYYNTVTR